MRGEEASPLGQIVSHLTASTTQAQAWVAAAAAVLLQAMLPTPSEAVAVASLVALCGLSEGLESLARLKRGSLPDRNELLNGIWRVLAYLIAPGLLGLMQLSFPGADAFWDAAFWGTIALFASREGSSCGRSLSELGAPLPEKLLGFLKGKEEGTDDDD